MNTHQILQRLGAVGVVAVLVAPALDARGSGEHGGGGAAAGSSKPVHVRESRKEGGTDVATHDLRGPGSKAEDRARPETPRFSSAPIHIVTDPVTGRKTITNDPIGPLATSAGPGRPSVSTAPIHIVTDSVTGRRTITNAPIPPLAGTLRPISTILVVSPAPPTGLGSRSTSASRDKRGRIQRSDAARRTFERQTGYPHGRPGYVIDHIRPLACGGADAPANMQWQTVANAKAKDKIERIGCR